jgi:hypothetical protein
MFYYGNKGSLYRGLLHYVSYTIPVETKYSAVVGVLNIPRVQTAMHTEQWHGGPVSQEAPKRTECKTWLRVFLFCIPSRFPSLCLQAVFWTPVIRSAHNFANNYTGPEYAAVGAPEYRVETKHTTQEVYC